MLDFTKYTREELLQHIEGLIGDIELSEETVKSLTNQINDIAIEYERVFSDAIKLGAKDPNIPNNILYKKWLRYLVNNLDLKLGV